MLNLSTTSIAYFDRLFLSKASAHSLPLEESIDVSEADLVTECELIAAGLDVHFCHTDNRIFTRWTIEFVSIVNDESLICFYAELRVGSVPFGPVKGRAVSVKRSIISITELLLLTLAGGNSEPTAGYPTVIIITHVFRKRGIDHWR